VLLFSFSCYNGCTGNASRHAANIESYSNDIILCNNENILEIINFVLFYRVALVKREVMNLPPQMSNWGNQVYFVQVRCNYLAKSVMVWVADTRVAKYR